MVIRNPDSSSNRAEGGRQNRKAFLRLLVHVFFPVEAAPFSYLAWCAFSFSPSNLIILI
jgi:hypothetical protein